MCNKIYSPYFFELLRCLLFVSMMLASNFAIYASTILPTSKNIYRFQENKGQWHPNILYKAELSVGALYLEKNKITYLLLEFPSKCNHPFHSEKDICSQVPSRAHAFRVHYLNANSNLVISPEFASSDYSNYFYSNTTASYVKAYKQIIYHSLYPNIDLVWYTDDKNQLKYDFICRPGSNPQNIELYYEGVSYIQLKENNLILHTSCGQIVESPPLAWQEINGKKIFIPCNYKIQGNIVTLDFPQGYNSKFPLIIDPTLVFSTYTGSYSDNWGFTATYDVDGALYSGGISHSTGYPVSVGALQVNFGGS
ncbi:MAG: hypothetical protein RML72_10550, partial [Bacteroidia bacterium]|nr:hypothetical protein [Bacteroidia bacterium]